MADPATVTQLLNAAQAGESSAIDQLFPLIYDELRQRAHAQRAGFGGHATMNTTAIVHEAYAKMALHDVGAGWHNRAHFFAIAAKAMRHVFLDYAKRKTRKKRGDGAHHVSLSDDNAPQIMAEMGEGEAEQVIALDAALTQLQRTNERASKVVECRFFGGMTVEDTALALDLSPATVKRDWVVARALLFQLIKEENRDGQ